MQDNILWQEAALPWQLKRLALPVKRKRPQPKCQQPLGIHLGSGLDIWMRQQELDDVWYELLRTLLNRPWCLYWFACTARQLHYWQPPTVRQGQQYKGPMHVRWQVGAGTW